MRRFESHDKESKTKRRIDYIFKMSVNFALDNNFEFNIKVIKYLL